MLEDLEAVFRADIRCRLVFSLERANATLSSAAGPAFQLRYAEKDALSSTGEPSMV